MERRRGSVQSLAQSQNASSNIHNDKYDKFCWQCHCKVNIRTTCKSCCRSFHKTCLPIDMQDRICSVCVKINDERRTNKNQPMNMRLLSCMLAGALKSPKFKMLEHLKCFKSGLNDDRKIIYPIDLHQINQKIDQHSYESYDDCLTDIEWVHHDCFVFFSENHKFTVAARELVDFCFNEVNIMRNCSNCYMLKHNRPSDWMTHTCEQPHLIIWVCIKQLDFWPSDKGFEYWPAKVLSAENDNLNIVYFGYHEQANVRSSDCYLYSRKNPNPENCISDEMDISDAIKEVELYMANVCKNFQTIVNTTWDLIALKAWKKLSEHVNDMFPNATANQAQARDVSTFENLLRDPNDRSTPITTTNQDMQTKRPGDLRKTAYFTPTRFGVDEFPAEKRYKVDVVTIPGIAPSMSACKENFTKCMSSFAGVFDQVFDINIKLEEQMKLAEEKHYFEIQELKRHNAATAKELATMGLNMQEDLESLNQVHLQKMESIKYERDNYRFQFERSQSHEKELNEKLRSCKQRYEEDVVSMKEMYEKKDAAHASERVKIMKESLKTIEKLNEQRDRQLEEAKKQCEEQFRQQIEEAKGNKYCIVCGVGRPLDMYYVCDKNCRKQYSS